jgi:hypothetical protein
LSETIHVSGNDLDYSIIVNVNPKRFQLALTQIQPDQWKRFEEVASEFLSAEYPNLRTMAAASGDGGRDSELFSPEDDPSVALQYSVTTGWAAKIQATANRITAEFPAVAVLIYVTNQLVGAAADDLRKKLRRNHNLFLDVRDRNWFVERLHSNQQREVSAEMLARDIVDPYLASAEIITRRPSALTSLELRAAFLYLGFQWEDDTREKGLTKLCFDGLVRAVLRDTDSENRLSREEVRSRVRSTLSNHSANEVDQKTDSALGRLTKKFIRHWKKTDEFCLTHDERLRLLDRVALHETADAEFQRELSEIADRMAGSYKVALNGQRAALDMRIRRVVEKFLLSRGEAFALAVTSGEFNKMGFDELQDIVIRDIGEHPDSEGIGASLVEVVRDVVREVVEMPSDTAQNYLRSLSDTYTLLAFLHETPDVQSAINKMFSGGEIWLDTSFVLPLFAEELIEPENRRFTNLLKVATEAGLRLFITEGVLEEVERHTNLCIVCHRMATQNWEGRLPFLYSLYMLSGRSMGEFDSWIERFRGTARPLDDIADYLNMVFGIELRPLEIEEREASEDLRHAVQEVWNEIHEYRRRKHLESDSMIVQRLASHDVENYVGVIEVRRAQRDSAFGYSSWWLTLDRDAFTVRSRLKDRLVGRPPDSPVLSPDFLANYLAFGPRRMQVSKTSELSLPVVIDVSMTDYLPPELIDIAEKVREEAKGCPEHVIRRRVRDKLDAAKMRRGTIADGGIGAMHEDLKDIIEREQTQPKSI